MNRSDKAVLKFLEGYNYAQAVLFSFCDNLQFDQNLALKLSCGLGAGMGRNEEVCGAITGGILALGIQYGRGVNEEKRAMEITYEKTRELMQKFKRKHGTFICRSLLEDCDLMTEQGQKYFKENDLLNKTCKLCVQSVVEILEELIK